MRTLADRVRVLEEVASTRPWLVVVVTDAQLIAEVARPYDVVVMGADKWRQVNDVAWYDGSTGARDEALYALPRALVVPRAGDRPDLGRADAELLVVADIHDPVSSSAVRNGSVEAMGWMLPEAAAFAACTGSWIGTGCNLSGDDRG